MMDSSTETHGRAIFVTVIFAVASFLSACLLFSVQPMIGKLILPKLGGTPAVWNTCMVFFQAMLLVGYLYSHLTTRWLGSRRQAVLHLFVLLSPLIVLPLASDGWGTPSFEQPVIWLITVLTLTAGLPFFAVSTSAPLLQKWFSGTGHRSADDPYFLYSAGNAGSLLALLGYPFVIEPMFSLAEQSRLWHEGYILLIVMTLCCALILWRSRREPADGKLKESRSQPSGDVVAGRVTGRRRLLWTLYAFAPSSLMLGVTTYITTDMAAVPLLWIIPLALYLTSFVLVFARRQILPRWLMSRVLAVLAIATLIGLIVGANHPPNVVIPQHLLMFFAACMVCHGALADDRPETEHLTEFYLWVSVGGVLGGIFNALIAPVLFSEVVEYPLVVILASFFIMETGKVPTTPLEKKRDYLRPLGLSVLTVLLVVIGQYWNFDTSRYAAFLLFALPAVFVLSFSDRPLRFALGLAAIWVGSWFYVGPQGRQLAAERSFFGVVRITNDPDSHNRLMYHGNTLHGQESLAAERRGEPQSYYHPSGPAGDIFEAFSKTGNTPTVGVIGLGAGSLASYAEPGQSWVYYEIDPTVEKFAREYFSFLKETEAAEHQVILGDGRIRIQEADDGAYGLLVLDAFSSDAIPMHLMTREALEIYRAKLSPHGVLAFHISNHYLYLEGVLGKLANDAGLVARIRTDDQLTLEDVKVAGRCPSEWVVMARREEDFGELADDPNWRPLQFNSQTPTWTDDFSSIFGLIRW